MSEGKSAPEESPVYFPPSEKADPQKMAQQARELSKGSKFKTGTTRRRFLRGLAGLLGLTLAGGVAAAKIATATGGAPETKTPTKPEPTPTPTSMPTPAPTVPKPADTPIPSPTPEQNKDQAPKLEQRKIEQINTILSLPINNPKRVKLERQFFSRAKTLAEIDAGFWVIGSNTYQDNNPQANDLTLRAQLLNKRYQLRLEGHNYLTPLTLDQIQWAETNGIHPEILGMAVDACKIALPLIQKIFDENRWRFRPDLAYESKIGRLPKDIFRRISTEDLIINPGGLAKLCCTETRLDFNFETSNNQVELLTYGFANTGTVPALSQINLNDFPSDPAALSELCAFIEKDTGIKFKPENIPGSIKGEGDTSGGAISVQMMPSKALEVYRLMGYVEKKYGFKINKNIFDPTTSLVYTIIFLAQGENVPRNELRYGYLRGEWPDSTGKDQGIIIRNKAVEKWNRNDEQVALITGAANSYWRKFPSGLGGVF